MFDDLAEQSAVFNLAAAIREDLLTPSAIFQRPGRFRAGVRGLLELRDYAAETTYLADCSFIASIEWPRVPPKIICSEYWVRREINWHIFHDGSLCYEFFERWMDRIAVVSNLNAPELAVKYAARWCLTGARGLLEKHLFAERQNIKIWPKEWDAWPHGVPAARYEYHQELKTA